MIHYTRNTENLKVAIREHTIAGYPLQLPSPFSTGIGISTVAIPSRTSVIAELDPAIHFDKLGNYRGWDANAYGYDYWVKYTEQHNLPRAHDSLLKWMHPHSREVLEGGYTLSERDIQARWLHELGHMDHENFIRKFSFDINSVSMLPEDLQPGMIVEFKDYAVKDAKVFGPFAGRVLAVEKDSQDAHPVVLLESFEPVPALLAPKSLAPWMIDPSYVSNHTWALGKGTYLAMKKKRVKIPLGMFDPEDPKEKVYFLDQPMPLSRVQSFCEKHFPGTPECVWQSMVFMVLPIHAHAHPKGIYNGGTFRPYPDDLQTTEIEAQIDYFTDEMEFEE
jgi:hypothetical protein